MTLFVQSEGGQAGGSGNIYKASNAQGETFALKRLKISATSASTESSEKPRRKELRHSSGSSNSSSPIPEYVTQGSAAAFYEEYRIHLAIGQLRGFPQVFGFGLIGNDPVIVMEWVEGATLRKALREREKREGSPLPLMAAVDLGIAILDALERANALEQGFVHRDLSPRNIMLRGDRTSPEQQLRTGEFDLCLIDFGSASPQLQTGADPTFTMSAGVWRMGTPAYAPPEMLSSDIAFPDGYRQSETIDTYALCSILYELYSGHTPYRIDPHGDASLYRIKTEQAPIRLVARDPDGGALARVIEIGLSPSQEHRPQIKQLKAALENWKRLPSQRSVEAVGLDSASPRDLWQPDRALKTLTRRRLLAGGIIIAAGIVSGALILGRKPNSTPSLDLAR